MGGEHRGGRGSEGAGLEARVVADEDGPAGVVLGEDAAGGVGDATQVRVREVVRR